ncbi:Rho termination factor N-terminal domain-containing protein, partial [Tessaracoccus sp.]
MTDSGSNNLAAMKLVELKSLAAGMGLKGVSAMRKGDLVAAIASGQGATRGASAPKAAHATRSERTAPAAERSTSEKRDAGSS